VIRWPIAAYGSAARPSNAQLTRTVATSGAVFVTNATKIANVPSRRSDPCARATVVAAWNVARISIVARSTAINCPAGASIAATAAIAALVCASQSLVSAYPSSLSCLLLSRRGRFPPFGRRRSSARARVSPSLGPCMRRARSRLRHAAWHLSSEPDAAATCRTASVGGPLTPLARRYFARPQRVRKPCVRRGVVRSRANPDRSVADDSS
jgi:hypothetical protein